MGKLIAGAILFALVVGSCGGTSAAPTPSVAGSAAGSAAASATPYPMTKITIGYDGQSISTGPMRYTLEQGIFKKYGLDVELAFVAGGSTLTAAVVGGNMPVAQNGYQPALSAMLQGADLVIVGGISNRLPFVLIAQSKYTTIASLKGKKLGISTKGSSSDIALRALVRSGGLNDNEDVTIVAVGGEPERTAALQAGAIDATVLQPPGTSALERAGYKNLGNAATVLDVPNTSYVVSRKFLKDNRDVVKRFLMAMLEGLHSYKTHPTEAIASTATFLNASVEDMKPAYDYYVKDIFPDNLRPSLTGIRNLLDQTLAASVPKAKDAKAEDFVDQSLLDELDREGFTKQILGK